MKRLYQQLVAEHFGTLRQMVFLAGPRQVGKTTTAQLLGEKKKEFFYFNWDVDADRQLILIGPTQLAEEIGLLQIRSHTPILVFDEIHKYGRWKQFLKGFFDLYGGECHILVTGSAKLMVYQRGGDSLMGRYFFYRIHPLSIGELLRPYVEERLIHPPKKLSEKIFKQLYEYGGFPEPYLKANRRFSTNWKRMRLQQLVREDIRDTSRIQELAQLEMLAKILNTQIGQLLNQSNLANVIHVSVPTVGRWLKVLEAFYYCFPIRPWTKNVKKSLKKEPKYYLWDWTLAENPSARAENFVASHLLKAVHFWTDIGLGEFDLYYVRDKTKREVDFLVTKNNIPWFLVEVKKGNNKGLNQSLYEFQEQTKASHAFQISFDLDYIDQDCFKYKKPVIVPASTFLSQLI